ncbi:MAG: hypothetical protein CMJ78_06120 [Planctomycetaceae bacterium]|nr:hypothetical protein [Planctomycetaceae bacterium]
MKQFVTTVIVFAGIVVASRFWSGKEKEAEQHTGYKDAGVASPSDPDPEESLPEIVGSAYLGVSSCAASGCHGGPIESDGDQKRGIWNSSYSVWATKDIHADAYSVLWSDRSRQIISYLTMPILPTEEQYAQHQTKLDDSKFYLTKLKKYCTSCHATYDPEQNSPDSVLVDGVSCESCHGAARDWLAEHTSLDWLEYPTSKKYTQWQLSDSDAAWSKSESKYKMTDTRDLLTRAKVCSDCHIGSPDSQGRPWRDLDHKIMAAGHPPLDFELAAYMENIPKHWDEDDDHRFQTKDRGKDDSKRAERSNFHSEVWSVGQSVSLLSRVLLLQSRAQAEVEGIKEEWPEFAERGCYECHHALKADSYRQRKISFKRGEGAWEPWYTPMAKALATHLEMPTVGQNIAKIEETMGPWWGKPEDASVAALAAIPSTRRMVSQILANPVEPSGLMQSLSKFDVETTRVIWSDVAQWYLAIMSTHNAIKATRDENDNDKALAAKMKELAVFLDFPAPVSADDGSTESYDSPRDFDPTVESFQRVVGEVRQLMKQVSQQ